VHQDVIRRWVVALLIVSGAVLPERAIGQSADDMAEARRLGHNAAAEVTRAPLAIIGLVGGVPLGVAASRYSGSQRNEIGALGPGIGVGVLLTGMVLTGRTGRPAVPVILETEAERQEYRRAYAARFQRRQRDALLIGGLVGIGVGVGVHSLSARWTR
jgi:hypothetical protein